MSWSVASIPDLSGRLAIVTGANSGIGYYTALELARAGASVIIASRNAAKGQAARATILAALPKAVVTFEMLDLASLAAVAAFSGRIAGAYPAVDILVNNAGVMALPRRELTADGLEMQLGTNYLGHFALTAHLLPLLRQAARPRIVQLSSLAHRLGAIDFDDLQGANSYKRFKIYAESKLAMLIFALELQRRSDANGWGLTSLAAHPGWSKTELINNSGSQFMKTFIALLFSLMAQSAPAGALPTLRAATDPDARGGSYYGPDGGGERTGAPVLGKIMPQALDQTTASRLWTVSEQLTGVKFGP